MYDLPRVSLMLSRLDCLPVLCGLIICVPTTAWIKGNLILRDLFVSCAFESAHLQPCQEQQW